MRQRLCLALALLLVLNLPAAAQELKPFVAGSIKEITAARQGKPFILGMWSLSCAHCVADLEIFKQLARKYPGFDLVLISTDTPEQEAAIADILKQYNLGQPDAKQKRQGKVESWIFADSYSERLRFEIDARWYGELPRTYFYDAAGKALGVSGVLNAKATELWVNNIP